MTNYNATYGNGSVLPEQLRGLQEKELQILKELKRVCEKNRLPYFLIFGTLIGAVRHGGFIPWDDDIDVCMSYPDYAALDKACKADLSDGYFLQTLDTDPECRLNYKKIRLNASTAIYENDAHKDMHHGISIDVYPLFHVADGKLARKFQLACAILYLLLSVGEPPRHYGRLYRLGGRVILGLCRGKFRKLAMNFCLKEMARYEDVNTEYRATFFGNVRCCKRLYPAALFESAVSMRFEDEEFSVPCGYDEFLKITYGDYWQLPPVEEQGAKLENIVMLDCNRSYLDYKGVYYCKNHKS